MRPEGISSLVPPPVARGLTPVGPEERDALAHWLGESPFTAIPLAGLKRGLCNAYVAGPIQSPRAAVTQVFWSPTDPVIFGNDSGALWQILCQLPGWISVNVRAKWMPDVRKVLEEKTGLTSRVMDDIYYILEHAHAAHSHPSVRLLTPADEELVLAADRMLWPDSFGNVRKSLQEGVNAGGVIDGRLVSRISSEPPGGRYTSLEAGTIEGWRGQGLATAATTLVARELQRRGLTPVWSTNNANLAPRRVAEKVGFRLFERQATIVFDGLKPYGYQPL